jgi:hypothetical protein
VALTVVGSNPIIYPEIFWYNLYQNLKIQDDDLIINRINILKFIKTKNIFKKCFKKIKLNLFLYYDFLKIENNIFLKNKKKFNLLSIYINYFFYKNKKNNFNKLGLKKYAILVINTTKKKTFVSFIRKNKSILNLTPGIITKKLDIKEKNAKKSFKILNLMIKTTINNVKKIYNPINYVIQIKGTKSNLNQLLNLLRVRLDFKKVFLIYTPIIGYNTLRFKKVRSIKKKLKKKFIKM